MSEIRKQIIANGVKALRKFGYPTVNAKNILTDRVYGAFFLSMLREATEAKTHPDVLAVAKKLISEIEASNKSARKGEVK